jgi:aminoglycoside phosphotransferase (APT) family kinase protein
MSEGSASATSKLHYYYYLMVTHPAEPRILMLPGEGGWALPCFEPEEHFHATGVDLVNREARAQLGLEATVLRRAYAEVDREVKMQVKAVFVLENHSPEWRPPAGSLWVGREELEGLELEMPEHREVIAIWLREDETGDAPPQRAPWARRGWFQAAEEWIRGELAAQGITPDGHIEQFKSWGISCVLRIPSTSGSVYFKAVPPLFISEPAITRALAARYPNHIPMPLAIAEHEEDSWMLMRDFGGHELNDATVPQWLEMLDFLGRIQREAVGSVDELLALRCADRRLDKLAAQVEPLIDYAASMRGLEEATIVKLRALAPTFKAMCEELAGYAVPQTLVHGDFHGGNIMIDDGNYIFFDWTDACIAHPFFDLPTLFDSYTPENIQAAAISLRDEYLRVWAGCEPPERLVEAFTLGYKLGMLHQAISYQHIIESLEPSAKRDLEGGLGYWLKKLLEAMTEGGPMWTKSRLTY